MSRVTSGTCETMRSRTSLRHKPSGPTPRRMRSTLYCVGVMSYGFPSIVGAGPNGLAAAATRRALEVEMYLLFEAVEWLLLFDLDAQVRFHGPPRLHELDDICYNTQWRVADSLPYLPSSARLPGEECQNQRVSLSCLLENR